MFKAFCAGCSRSLPFHVRDEGDSALRAACPTCAVRFWRLDPITAEAAPSHGRALEVTQTTQDLRTAYQSAAVSASACAVSREKLRDLSETAKNAKKIMEAAQERHERAQRMLISMVLRL